MSENLVGRLEDEALKRKERLKALKRGEVKTLKATTVNNESASQHENSDESDATFPKPIFRNYTPIDDELKPGILPKPDLVEIEDEIKDKLESGKPKLLIEKEIDLTNLAPQKVDWDLKRDLEKRMKVLEKKTQRTIVELIRDRLKEKNNLAELVSIGTSGTAKQNVQGSSDDDDEDDQENSSEDEENVNRRKAAAADAEENENNGIANSDEKEETTNSKFLTGEISDDDDY